MQGMWIYYSDFEEYGAIYYTYLVTVEYIKV